MKHTKKRSLQKKSTRRNKRKHRGGSNIVDVVFSNDNNVIIKVDTTLQFSELYKGRVSNEPLYRKIINYMIQNNIINKDKNIIDLGAYIGDNTLPWAKNINGIVYGIDPSPNNCSFIKKLITINNITNVNVIQEVVSDKEENLSLDLGEWWPDINHARFTANNKNNGKYKSTTLDLLYNKNTINNIGFIHLDVEGMEYKIIEGSKNLIEKEKPIVSYETHSSDKNIENIKQYFINNNYTIFKIEEVCGGDQTCRNSVAIPNSIISNIKLEDMYSNLNIDNTIFIKEL